MRRFYLLLSMLMVMGCSQPNDPKGSVNGSSHVEVEYEDRVFDMMAGGSYQLRIVYYEDVEDGRFYKRHRPAPLDTYRIWSDNEDVVTVTPEGMVTAVGVGETAVWIKGDDFLYDDEITESIHKVRISVDPFHFSELTRDISLEPEQIYRYYPIDKDAYRGDYQLSWSADSDAVRILEDGYLEVLDDFGAVRVTVLSPDESQSLTTRFELRQSRPFVSKWNTENGSYDEYDQITLYWRIESLSKMPLSFTMDWGDGNREYVEITEMQSSVLHQYDESGIYEIRILGDFYQWLTGSGTDVEQKLIEISDFGRMTILDPDPDSIYRNVHSPFYHASNLDIVAENGPDISQVTELNSFFQGCSNLTDYPGIRFWDTAHIEDMSCMFSGATSFNGDISMWDTGSVKDMDLMFAGAEEFNQDISDWNFEEVASMSNMFLNSNLSMENYDALLISWAKQDVKHNVILSVSSKYSEDAQEARTKLIDDYSWFINDWGLFQEDIDD